MLSSALRPRMTSVAAGVGFEPTTTVLNLQVADSKFRATLRMRRVPKLLVRPCPTICLLNDPPDCDVCASKTDLELPFYLMRVGWQCQFCLSWAQSTDVLHSKQETVLQPLQRACRNFNRKPAPGIALLWAQGTVRKTPPRQWRNWLYAEFLVLPDPGVSREYSRGRTSAPFGTLRVT